MKGITHTSMQLKYFININDKYKGLKYMYVTDVLGVCAIVSLHIAVNSFLNLHSEMILLIIVVYILKQYKSFVFMLNVLLQM